MELSASGGAGHVVIGGGVLGLSAAWRLAERGADVVVLEKDRIGAGASGIAGGIVRNYSRSAAISEVIRRSVELFEAESEAFGFRQVGYVAAVPEAQVDDLKAIRDHHERVGYESELVVGAERCREYLEWTWPDWDAEVAALLHERRGGWADAMQTVRHLADRAQQAGARIEEGTEVSGFEIGSDGVEAVLTSRGRVACGVVLAAPGPWAAGMWARLGQGSEVEVAENGDRERRPLFSYLKAQEGEFALPGVGLAGSAGHEAPVVHLDQAGPLLSDSDGRTLVDGPWGIYFRMGRTGTGITGGGLPVALDDPALDPYGPDNPAHAAEPSFGEFFTSGLAAAIRRFRGRSDAWSLTPAGGIVMRTPDNYPICDRVLPNAYAIVDSGHGFKMLALGRLAADDLLDGGEPLLEPFRLDRFERGETHTASKGPYPWT
ncbi:MAG: NAD(P)/FAD-dependent oxidoreductase [Solirubrobacterales bacterium]